MLHKRKAIVFTLAAVLAAGCARSDYRVSRLDGAMRPSVADAAILNAPEAKAPKILPETHYAAARLFESQGLIGRAITQYRKAVAVNHSFMKAYHRLGLLLSRIGEHEEALEAFGRAVELGPDDAIQRNNFGFELLLARRWADAERELCRAIELMPAFARARVNLGVVQSKLGRFDEALASFQTVVPEADAYYNLGLMYRGQRMYEEAADAFQHVLSIRPDFSAAQTQLEQIASHLEPEITSDADIKVAELTPKVDAVESAADPALAPYDFVTTEPAVDEYGPPTDEAPEAPVVDLGFEGPDIAKIISMLRDLNDRADEAAADPTDWWAVLGELEEQLAIVRNDIACLESLIDPLTGTAGTQDGATSSVRRPTKASRVIDQRTADPNQDANTPEPSTEPDTDTPGNTTQPEQADEPRTDAPAQQRTPGDRSSSSRAVFEEPLGLLEILLNEIACWKAAEADLLPQRAPGETLDAAIDAAMQSDADGVSAMDRFYNNGGARRHRVGPLPD